MDADFASHSNYDSFVQAEKEANFLPLEEVLDFMGTGHTPYKHDMKSGDVGFITIDCITDLNFHHGKLKNITSEQYFTEFSNRIIKKNDVLCTIKRRVCKAYPFLEAPNQSLTINQDIALLRPKCIISSGYLASYLCCTVGQQFSDLLKTEQMNPYISSVQLKKLPIAIPSKYFGNRIDKVIISANQKLEQSKSTYAQAEQTLLEELGLANFTPSNDPVNIKSFSDSFATSGRLDAEYYQKKYDDFKKSLESYSRGFTTIKDEYRHIKKACSRTLNEYHYTEISNINVGDGSFGKTIRQTDELPANAKICAQFGDLLISKVRPNRGAVSIVSYTGNDLIVSGAFTVLREKKDTHFKLRALQVLLRTKIYKDWLLQSNVGTQYPVITDDDVLSLTIPKIEDTTQQTIAALVEESFALKHQSKHLLDVAKRAVEIAIEQNEGAATAYIDQHIK